MEVHEIPLHKIIVGEARQRSDMGEIEEMMYSIEQFGLIQPIVVTATTDGRFKLVAGGRRFEAHKRLEVPTIKAIIREEADEATLFELELEENIRRKDLTLQEEVAAVNRLFRLKKAQYSKALPGHFSMAYNQRDLAKELGVSEGKISQDLALAEAMEKYPELASAKTRKDAQRILRRIQEGGYHPEEERQNSLRENFLFAENNLAYKSITTSSVDLVFIDGNTDFDPVYIEIAKRMMNPTSQGFLFTSLPQVQRNLELLKSLGFIISANPLIWHIKGEDSYIPFLWFSRYIQEPTKDLPGHISARRDKTAIHTQAKPYQLYHQLISVTTVKAMMVVEFNALSAACALVCADFNRNTRVFCRNRAIFDQCLLNH